MSSLADVLTLRHSRLRSQEWTPFALCLPVVLVLLVFFVWPVWNLLLLSFEPAGTAAVRRSGWTVAQYTRFLLDEYYLGILARTLRVSAVVTILSLLVGYPVGYYLAAQGASRVRALLMFFIVGPMMVSIVIRTYGWMVLLSPTGAVNSLLMATGLGREPYRLMYNDLGIVIGLLNILLPLMILSVHSALVRMDLALIRAAANLGATPWRVFLHINLPLSLPGIVAGSVLVFTLASSYFVTPAILGGSRARVMAYVAYEQALELTNWPFGAAVTVILFVIICASTVAYQRLLESSRWRRIFH